MEVAGVVLSGVQTGLSIAQTMFNALQCRELRQICSILGNESELEKLEGTVSTIRAALLDVEAKEANQELSHQEKDWLEKLKDALYDADDLLDQFATLARKQQQLLERDEEGSKKEQVRSWFSLSPLKKMNDALSICIGVQGIRKKLDAIASDYSKFGFKVNYEPIRRRREETCSYVYEKCVIGREGDKKAIVDMLLDHSTNVQDKDVSLISIVGVGGLGKTTLAQLVYNDERVKANFPLRLWTCVADQDNEHLDVKGILGKLLNSVTGQNYGDAGLEWVHRQFQQLISGKKYLLVLDDVWSENPVEMRKLAGFLMGGQRGSWVAVTTRSKQTARVIGNGHSYKLGGLSEEDSWHLFETVAFGEGQEQPNVELVEIGKKIVGKCSGIPLAIRVVGSLLYGQGKRMWLSYQENGIAYTGQCSNDILPILKFSYYRLEPSLKSCFSFCALFPKDSVMEKETLIRVWMAHGCVVPFYRGQSIEDATDEHFSVLLRRCFFQDVKKDKFSEILSCKVHDLMHDIAQEVAGKEIFITDSITSNLDSKIRHLFLTQGECAESVITKTKLRTYLHKGDNYHRRQKIPVGTVLASWVCIRVLDLSGAGVESLPETIGNLVHLRYLNLSYNFTLEMLPQSITKLYNLQTLLLKYCSKLLELPKDLSKLVQLRVLDLEECHKLTCMPSTIKELTCLCILSAFVVGSPTSSFEQCVYGLEALRGLTNLKGCLHFYFKKISSNTCTYDKEKARRGGYLKGMQHLKGITLCCKDEDDYLSGDHTEALVEGLEPHPNLQALTLKDYNSPRIPIWVERLTNLVVISLDNCGRLRYLPSLGRLPRLKELCLDNLPKMEWMENSTTGDSASGAALARVAAVAAEHVLFFPSLEHLCLFRLPKLKGWWRSEVGVVGDADQLADSFSSHFPQPSFPRLSNLEIKECPHLTSIPLCPNLEYLKLQGFNESLCPIIMRNGKASSSSSSATASTSLSSSSNICRNLRNSNLRSIWTSNVGYLNSLLMEAFQCLTKLEIFEDQKVESLSEVVEVFRSCSSSLKSLSLFKCNKLSTLHGGLDHLTALKALSICCAINLDMVEGEEEPWRSLEHSLRYLELSFLPKLVELPKGMQHLTSLRNLEISFCSNLEMVEKEEDGMLWRSIQHTLHSLVLCGLPKLIELPKGMEHLTSLRSLNLRYCKNLKCLPQWGSCFSSLQSLTIYKCENLQGLPEWVCGSSSLCLEIE